VLLFWGERKLSISTLILMPGVQSFPPCNVEYLNVRSFSILNQTEDMYAHPVVPEKLSGP